MLGVHEWNEAGECGKTWKFGNALVALNCKT